MNKKESPQQMKSLWVSWVITALGVFLTALILGSCTLEKPPIRPKKNLTPDEPVYYDFIARKYYIRGEYDKAIFQYQKIIDKFSGQSAEFSKDLAWAEYEIGFCYYKLGDKKKAEEYFNRVINLHNLASARILAEKVLKRIQTE